MKKMDENVRTWYIKEIFEGDREYRFNLIKRAVKEDDWYSVFEDYVIEEAYEWVQGIKGYPDNLDEKELQKLYDFTKITRVRDFVVSLLERPYRGGVINDFFIFEEKYREAFMSWYDNYIPKEFKRKIEIDPRLPDSDDLIDLYRR